MKKTYYLFNPGTLQRKDNTLKFTPIEEDANGIERNGQPRYLPVEDIAEFYIFGSLMANVRCIIFWAKRYCCAFFRLLRKLYRIVYA
jgi:CRISPR-associated protein Cas1